MSAAAQIASVSSEFDIFAHGPIQTSILGTTEVAYKPIAPVEKKLSGILIPADTDKYMDLDIKLYIRGKLISASGKDVDLSDHTGVKNIYLHSLFNQCNFILNGVNITKACKH